MWELLAQVGQALGRDLIHFRRAVGRAGQAARSALRGVAFLSGAALVAVASAMLSACESAPAQIDEWPAVVATAAGSDPAVPERPRGLGDASAPSPGAGAPSSTSAAGAQPPVAAASAAPAEAAPAASAGAPPPPPPPPARSESNGYAIHWQRPVARAADDQVEAVTQGWRRGVRLVVTSSGGIGQVEVRPTRGGWPNQVQVEFRYAPDRPFNALEGMRFQVINPAHTAGDEVPPLVPDKFVFWQRDGRFWLDLPSGWLRGQQGLRIAWVDRYRR
ncbi:MAG TPA: hypothetical protein PK947_08910 [Ottowia sp.]|nr:hypothetical protein [Ottowia sp.]